MEPGNTYSNQKSKHRKNCTKNYQENLLNNTKDPIKSF